MVEEGVSCQKDEDSVTITEEEEAIGKIDQDFMRMFEEDTKMGCVARYPLREVFYIRFASVSTLLR